ncbi:MAG: Hsp20/alpha crystallin family protein [Nitrospirae bacterium]|nr:MAG: Hsp20/alpha crystallin family protein [Nitrospirota bacterium]
MALTAYDPFEAQIERMFNEALQSVQMFRQPGMTSMGVPPCNVWEDDEQYGFELAIPGWKAEQIDIQVENGVLRVEGKAEPSSETPQMNGRTYHVRQIPVSAFTWSYCLPPSADPDQAKAVFRDGLVMITVPKKAHARPRQITIQ